MKTPSSVTDESSINVEAFPRFFHRFSSSLEIKCVDFFLDCLLKIFTRFLKTTSSASNELVDLQQFGEFQFHFHLKVREISSLIGNFHGLANNLKLHDSDSRK